MYGRRRNYAYGTYNKKKYTARGKKPLAGYGRSIGQYGKFQINKSMPDTVTKELKFFHRNGLDPIEGINNNFNARWCFPTVTSTNDADDKRTLVNIKMGNAGYEREGRKIVVKSLKFKGLLSSPVVPLQQDNLGTDILVTPNSNSGYVVRFIIFKDKQANALGVTQLSDLIDLDFFTHGLGADPGGVDKIKLLEGAVFGGRNMYNSDRFEFLCDDLYTTTSTTITAIGNPALLYMTFSPIKIEKEFKLNTPILYNEQNTSGVIENIKSNNFQFACVGNWGKGGDVGMTMQWAHEIRYYDD